MAGGGGEASAKQWSGRGGRTKKKKSGSKRIGGRGGEDRRVGAKQQRSHALHISGIPNTNTSPVY